ncbi:hypothetical protein HJC23_012047, partial [Cyclotella cryptica]
CLLDKPEQKIHSEKKSAAGSIFKDGNQSCEAKVDGGNCPVCHMWVKLTCVIQVTKAQSREIVPMYQNEDSCVNKNLPGTFALKRNNIAWKQFFLKGMVIDILDAADGGVLLVSTKPTLEDLKLIFGS